MNNKFPDMEPIVFHVLAIALAAGLIAVLLKVVR